MADIFLSKLPLKRVFVYTSGGILGSSFFMLYYPMITHIYNEVLSNQPLWPSLTASVYFDMIIQIYPLLAVPAIGVGILGTIFSRWSTGFAGVVALAWGGIKARNALSEIGCGAMDGLQGLGAAAGEQAQQLLESTDRAAKTVANWLIYGGGTILTLYLCAKFGLLEKLFTLIAGTGAAAAVAT